MKILIVGAGPTGLTAAVELARLGIIPKIIDKKSERSTLSRAVGILPASLQILESSGVSSLLLEKGIKIDKFNFYHHTQSLARFSLQKDQFQYPFMLTLAQDETEKILESRFKAYGGSVEYGCKLIDLENRTKDVQVKLSSGDEGKYDYVLGCDGVHSQTRQSLGLDYPGFELNETWSIADVDIDDWVHAKQATIFLLDQGKAMIAIPLEVNRYRLVSNTADVLSRLPLACNIKRVRREGTFSLAVRQVDNYRSGKVYLAGDAAHCHTPFGGRGMNLGIADAAEFAHRLVEDTLDQYNESRSVAGKKVIKESENFRRSMTAYNRCGHLFCVWQANWLSIRHIFSVYLQKGCWLNKFWLRSKGRVSFLQRVGRGLEFMADLISINEIN